MTGQCFYAYMFSYNFMIDSYTIQWRKRTPYFQWFDIKSSCRFDMLSFAYTNCNSTEHHESINFLIIHYFRVESLLIFPHLNIAFVFDHNLHFAELKTFVVGIAVLTVKFVVSHSHVCSAGAVAQLYLANTALKAS